MRKMNTNLKKKIVGFAFATMILASSVIPTYAATATAVKTISKSSYVSRVGGAIPQ